MIGPYDCRVPVRPVQRRPPVEASRAPKTRVAGGPSLCAVLAVTLWVVPTARAGWSAPATPRAARRRSRPRRLWSCFPPPPSRKRSGPGTLLWTAPRGCAARGVGVEGATETLGATLGADDLPGPGRALVPASRRPRGGHGRHGHRRGRRAHGGRSTGVAAVSGYLGDAVLASLGALAAGRLGDRGARAAPLQLHARARPRLVPAGAGPVTRWRPRSTTVRKSCWCGLTAARSTRGSSRRPARRDPRAGSGARGQTRKSGRCSATTATRSWRGAAHGAGSALAVGPGPRGAGARDSDRAEPLPEGPRRGAGAWQPPAGRTLPRPPRLPPAPRLAAPDPALLRGGDVGVDGPSAPAAATWCEPRRSRCGAGRGRR